MTRKSIGLLSVAIACVTAASISISSCNSNSTAPTTPGNGGVDRSKNPQALSDGDLVAVGFTTSPNGGTSVQYDDDGSMGVQGLDGTDGNTVTTRFDSPVNNYHTALDVTFPASGGGLFYEANDVDGTTQARLDFKSKGADYEVFPTFTSHQDQGEGTPQYDVYIYNNGAQVASKAGLSASSSIVVKSDAGCPPKVTGFGWNANPINFQCALKLGLNPCCTYTFRLPDGSTYIGNGIQFIENNTQGVYVYTQSGSITIGGTTATYTNRATSVYAR